MVERFKYTVDFLKELESKKSAILVGDYSKTPITGKTKITYICKCNTVVNDRRFDFIKKYGGMECNICNRKNKKVKTIDYTKRCRYNIDLLLYLIKRDGASLEKTPEKLNFRTAIQFTCKCGNNTTKMFGHINKFNGAFCKSCGTDKESYDINLLLKIAKKYNATFTSNGKNLTCNSMITFICSCGKEETKQFSILKTSSGGMRCYNCAKCKGRDKYKLTNEIRFGGHPMTSNNIKNKIQNTCIEKYGVNNTFASEEIKQRICNTNLIKYGVKYPSQSSVVQDKIQRSLFKFKNYTMPNGEIRKIQGYEHLALDELIQEYNPDEIITSRKSIPRIKYIKNNKECYYFPDIYIPKINMIIEVKSDYTYTLNHQIIVDKQEATKKMGYNYEIWIYTKKGEKKVIQ